MKAAVDARHRSVNRNDKMAVEMVVEDAGERSRKEKETERKDERAGPGLIAGVGQEEGVDVPAGQEREREREKTGCAGQDRRGE